MNIVKEFNEILAFLFFTDELPDDIPLEEKSRIVRRVLLSSVKLPNLDVQALRCVIYKEKKDYLKTTRHHYVLLSSISIKHTDKLTSRRIKNANITFHSKVSQTFDRSPFSHRISLLGRDKIEDQFASVFVKIQARTPAEAVDLGLYALDLLRGCWNLYFNYKWVMKQSMGMIQPVNIIKIGRIHTVHEPNGKCAGEVFWYEPDFTVPIKVDDHYQEWDKVCKFEKWIRKNLKNNPYRTWLEDSIVRYCKALDEKMFENTFLKLWSLLERLTGTLKMSYAITIKRTVFRYSDRQRAEMELEHLREQRNRTAHHTNGKATPEGITETIVYQLKKYVENHLLFLIKWLRTFDSFEEYWNFLEQPTDKNALRKRILLAKRALKMIEGN